MSSAGVLEAAAISEFVNARVGHDFGTPHIPTLFERPEVQIAALLTLIGGAYSAWQLYNAPWIGHPAIWATGCVAVFLFATSGACLCVVLCAVLCMILCTAAVMCMLVHQGFCFHAGCEHACTSMHARLYARNERAHCCVPLAILCGRHWSYGQIRRAQHPEDI